MKRPSFPEQKSSQYWATYNPNYIGMISLSFESTEVEKGSAFLQEKADGQYEELLYLFQHQGCELSSQLSFLHLLLPSKSFTQFNGDKPWWSLEICIEMLPFMESGWLDVSKLLFQWNHEHFCSLIILGFILSSSAMTLWWSDTFYYMCVFIRERAVMFLQVHDWTRYCSPHSTVMLTLLFSFELKASLVHGDL